MISCSIFWKKNKYRRRSTTFCWDFLQIKTCMKKSETFGLRIQMILRKKS